MKAITKALKEVHGISVRNMTNYSGNPIPNQFEITTTNGYIFQSYRTVIAAKVAGEVFLDKNNWAYSNTTGKYRNQFLGEDRKETERKIKSGEYQLVDLNKGV